MSGVADFVTLAAYEFPFPAFVLLAVLSLSACGQNWNDPYPRRDEGKAVLYTVFEERPKHLDPARSYSSNEVEFTGQIYEPPCNTIFSNGLTRWYRSPRWPCRWCGIGIRRAMSCRQRAAGEDRTQQLRYSHQAGHPLPAASRLRTAAQRPAALSGSAGKGPGAHQHAAGFSLYRHARIDGRGLRVRNQAAGQPAAEFADFRPDDRIH